MYRRRLAVLLVFVLSLLLSPLSVCAIANPDSGPFILKTSIYRHLLENDDLLVHSWYSWPYSAGPPDTIPAETITQAVFARLLNGATEVATGTAYSYHRRGWGYGSLSMYLNAADAVGLWGLNLTVEFRGSPTLTWTGAGNHIATTPSVVWVYSASISATQLMLYTDLMAWASTLGDYWGYALVTTYPGSDKLSGYGEAYFPNAITGLRTMVPQLFVGVAETPEYTEIEYTAAVTSAWPFDFSGLSVYFGLPNDDEVLRTIIAFIIIFAICSIMVARGIPVNLALFSGFALFVVLSVPGFISRVMVGGAVFLIVLIFGAVFLLRRQ